MPLLTQDPLAPQGGGAMQPEAPHTGEPQEAPEAQEQAQGMTFTAEQLADSFKEQMDEEQAKDMSLVVEEGKQLLFGPDSHSKIMGMLEGSKNIGEDLGNGAFDAMNLVLGTMAKEKPGEEIDAKSILPAGVVLIALALEFVNESGMAPVSEDDFEEAAHIFSTRMLGTHDPEFKERAAQHQTQQPAADAQAAPVTAPSQQGGM